MKKIIFICVFIISMLFLIGCGSEEQPEIQEEVDLDALEEELEEMEEVKDSELPEPVVMEKKEVVEQEPIVEEASEPEVVEEESEVIEVHVEESESLDTDDSGTVHTVVLEEYAFPETSITINVGDTVRWTHNRKAYDKTKIYGTQTCSYIKSDWINAGEEFSHTFDEPGKCTFVDIIYSNQIMSVVVED